MPRTIAYLGPAGTYGEQAANHFARRLGGGINLRPCDTIGDVYAASKACDYAVLPLENTLQGVVLETVDALLSPLADPAFPAMEYLYPPTPDALASQGGVASPTAPEQPHIVADTTLSISHQLVGLRGSRLEDIRYVRSHEQALGQCSAWLDNYLPHAERVPWPSTAGALTSVLAQGDKSGAAICSRAAVEREGSRVNVLAEGVQGVKNNFTRFLLLSREAPAPPPADAHKIAFYALRDIGSIGAISHFGPALSIHQRPAPPGAVAGVPFPRFALAEVRVNALAMDTSGAILMGSFNPEDVNLS
ncbi:uncharacterized protein CcaverHIS019_0109410 [Cutaneotrichosporon cavernicola]|uniref:Prephenate dehydratase domain-containing protein n=1 Tax=Cutaneotrichosporon cavernicola TaxID=279322 RepID=A0AA48L286_9TREE|nr:uncharacterized protein CcaverHIS019_0109410 [Cutaneotrichosporon cavernicola]BEI88223.1 hypothetical protein CcaverHIS019_0109410 [Cutaneotrichosporon cavernicola]BEI95994.1 hypothetical protein CcaverHIS631_0109430 [Cutaneotrichosporon cavernicola]